MVDVPKFQVVSLWFSFAMCLKVRDTSWQFLTSQWPSFNVVSKPQYLGSWLDPAANDDQGRALRNGQP